MRLIECLDCRTENTLDSRFCRNCGGRLPEDAIMELKAENHNLVQDAKMLFNDHRFSECKMLVESVLEVEPGNVDALALLADCYEREDRLQDAIELYEKVVIERPDSALDRVRLAHLRKLAYAEELEVVEPQSRRNALFAGVAGTVLLFSIGAAFMLAMNPTQADANADLKNLTAQNQPDAVSYGTTLVPPVPTYEPTNSGANAEQAGDGNEVDLAPPITGDLVSGGLIQRPDSRRNGSGIGMSQPVVPDQGLQPLVVTPSQVPQGTGNASSRPTNPGPDPQTTIDPGNNSSEGEKPKENNPGVIEITVHDGKSNGASTNQSDNTNAANAVDALIVKARDLFAQGDYAQAVKSYEEALRQGASAGSTNQRIGQCYEKLGNRSAAIAAYQRAVTAYEASIARGSGGSRTQTALSAVKQAIKNLGG